ncbi:hypothetical protein JMJ77_0001918, partial [Colletotrichum scovillei]
MVWPKLEVGLESVEEPSPISAGPTSHLERWSCAGLPC